MWLTHQKIWLSASVAALDYIHALLYGKCRFFFDSAKHSRREWHLSCSRANQVEFLFLKMFLGPEVKFRAKKGTVINFCLTFNKK